MRQSRRSRLQKLQAALVPTARQVIVFGYSDEEHEAKITELKVRGEASEADTFVCISRMSPVPPTPRLLERFPEPSHQKPPCKTRAGP